LQDFVFALVGYVLGTARLSLGRGSIPPFHAVNHPHTGSTTIAANIKGNDDDAAAPSASLLRLVQKDMQRAAIDQPYRSVLGFFLIDDKNPAIIVTIITGRPCRLQ
jgi:hypothetical protein